jgi:DNA-binding transcriptional ArsR family regulator
MEQRCKPEKAVMVSSDLLTKIRGELDVRLRELRPLLSEYERLLAAAEALAPAGEMPARARDRAAPRVAGTDTLSAAPRSHDRRSSRWPISDRSAAVASRPAPRRAGGVPKPARKRAQRGAAALAILAALEHGSHTASELLLVTAMSPPIINNNLRRLQQAGTITRTKRDGDGKVAYALVPTPA